jgi:hypothetical protein
MSKLDAFDDNKARCKDCKNYYEIRDWGAPLKDRGLGGSIKNYTFRCRNCVERTSNKRDCILEKFRADKITMTGFFYENSHENRRNTLESFDENKKKCDKCKDYFDLEEIYWCQNKECQEQYRCTKCCSLDDISAQCLEPASKYSESHKASILKK